MCCEFIRFGKKDCYLYMCELDIVWLLRILLKRYINNMNLLSYNFFFIDIKDGEVNVCLIFNYFK